MVLNSRRPPTRCSNGEAHSVAAPGGRVRLCRSFLPAVTETYVHEALWTEEALACPSRPILLHWLASPERDEFADLDLGEPSEKASVLRWPATASRGAAARATPVAQGAAGVAPARRLRRRGAARGRPRAGRRSE